MSKFDIKKMRCNICGREQEVTVLAMATQHGLPDLDFRPPEVRRSAMPPAPRIPNRTFFIAYTPRCISSIDARTASAM